MGKHGQWLPWLVAALVCALVHGPVLASGQIRVVGATTIQPVMERLSTGFMQSTSWPVSVEGGGSSVGLRAVMSGSADIGMVSRALTENEKNRVSQKLIGYDAVVMIVNAANPITELSRNQVVGLFTGSIRHWGELASFDESVVLVSKEVGRATLDLFQEYTGLVHPSLDPKTGHGPPIADHAHEIGSNLESCVLVGGLPGAVGYVSYGTATSFQERGLPIRILSLDGVKATPETMENGSYPILRELNLVYVEYNVSVHRYLEYVDQQGQHVVRDEGFIPWK